MVDGVGVGVVDVVVVVVVVVPPGRRESELFWRVVAGSLLPRTHTPLPCSETHRLGTLHHIGASLASALACSCLLDLSKGVAARSFSTNASWLHRQRLNQAPRCRYTILLVYLHMYVHV